MHENSKRNAMLTKQRKKRGKGNKLQQGGAGSIMGVCSKKKNGLGLTGKKWAAGQEPVRFKGANGSVRWAI